GRVLQRRADHDGGRPLLAVAAADRGVSAPATRPAGRRSTWRVVAPWRESRRGRRRDRTGGTADRSDGRKPGGRPPPAGTRRGTPPPRSAAPGGRAPRRRAQRLRGAMVGMKATLCSRNPHKARELERLLPGWMIETLDAEDFPPEDGATSYDNARAKAEFGRRVGARDRWMIGEDSSLEVVVLDGVLGTLAMWCQDSETSAISVLRMVCV